MPAPLTVEERAAPATVTTPDRPRWHTIAPAVALSVLVAGVHFRPWQGGMLEDWTTSVAWDTEGMGGLAERMPLMMGRPLHLIPHYLGLSLSDGGFVGMYVVLAAVAVAQLLAAAWAVRAIIASPMLRWALALVVALHPWWAAGGLLRFLSAQVAVLGLVLWLGAAVRLLRGGSRSWVWLMVLAPTLGLLTYQAPAGVLVVGSVLLACRLDASTRRRWITVAVTSAVSVGVMAWSALIAPRLTPEAYENTLLVGGLDLVAAVRAIARTLALHAPATAFMLLAVAALVITLGFHQAITPRDGGLLLAGLALAPLTALVYAGQPFHLHLHDPERVSLPVGLTAWIVLACALAAAEITPRWQWALVAVLVTCSAAGALVGYSTWTRFASAQQSLLDVVEPIRATTPADQQLVIADHTGKFGDMYLLLPPHLTLALLEESGPGVEASICTPDDVVRDHPIATRLPITTTPACSELLPPDATPVATVDTDLGVVDVYAVPAA